MISSRTAMCKGVIATWDSPITEFIEELDD